MRFCDAANLTQMVKNAATLLFNETFYKIRYDFVNLKEKNEGDNAKRSEISGRGKHDGGAKKRGSGRRKRRDL